MHSGGTGWGYHLGFAVGRLFRWLFRPARPTDAADLTRNAVCHAFARKLDATDDIVAALLAEPDPPKESSGNR